MQELASGVHERRTYNPGEYICILQRNMILDEAHNLAGGSFP